jgi:hypothetical protein
MWFEFNAICRAIFRRKALRNSPRVNSKAQPQRATNSVDVREHGHFRRGTFPPNSIVKLNHQIFRLDFERICSYYQVAEPYHVNSIFIVILNHSVRDIKQSLLRQVSTNKVTLSNSKKNKSNDQSHFLPNFATKNGKRK